MTANPRLLHILPIIGTAGAERMAANLLVPLSRSYQAGAVGLYGSMSSNNEAAIKDAGIPIWFLGKRPGFDPRMYARLDRVLREFRPQIVHSHLSVLRYLLPSLIRRRAEIAVHTVHNLAERETDRVGRLVRHFVFHRLVVPVAVSGAVARSVRQVYGGEQPITIPNGVPVANFRFDPSVRASWRNANKFDQQAFLFIATGRLERQKNPLLLIRAFAELGENECHLLLVGDGPLRPQVEEQIQRLGIGNRVHVLGRRSDVGECLAAADAFVMSSDWEGNPLGLMEAMACGLPVIATAVGGVPELVDDGRHGLLVSAGDGAALTNAMRCLLGSAVRRQAMGQAASCRAQAEFTLERMVEAYDNLYRRLLEGAPANCLSAAMESAR